jgi:PiT family inorganic phosphate transporter
MESFLRDIAAIFANPYVALIFLTALAFDFINGFHDAANSIATIVGTRVLRPLQAVLWAAWWNFAAAWFFGVHVANTVAKWVDKQYVTPEVIFAGLLGAILWNLITWYAGLPSSSSHALLGGFGGAALVYAGKWVGVINIAKLMTTLYFIILAPLIGLVFALGLTFAVFWIFRRFSPGKIDRWFRVIQLGSAACYSLGHGANDAQKTMGIIAALFLATIWKGKSEVNFEDHHFWIVLVCHLAIGLGTLSGGWRIVKTMGLKITKLKPWGGACAETAAAGSLFIASALGVPVSTTHTITGAIVGVGAIQRLSAVRWGVARQVIWAWVLTIPCSALVAAICQWVLQTIRS